jgi:predicted DNA-binding transcriptional regulator YafY
MLDLDGWRRVPDEPLSPGDWADGRVQALQAAIQSSARVRIDYHKSNGEFHSGRPIRPRRVFRKAGQVYCEAYCELRDEIRHFRIDRISRFQEEMAPRYVPPSTRSKPNVLRREPSGCLLYVLLAFGLICLIAFLR